MSAPWRQLSTDATDRAEQEMADALAPVWGAQFHHYGRNDSVDWWIEQSQRCVAFAEMKDRKHLPSTYPTVYLAVRKWLALMFVEMRGPLGLFVVRFADMSIWAVNVNDIDPRQRIVVRGRSDRVGVPNDREPVVEVPMADMRRVI
jgi:hypothetical protein